MRDYRTRLDRIEAAIAPGRGCPHLVWRNAGQTAEEATEEYAAARGVTVAEVRASMICFSWEDSRL